MSGFDAAWLALRESADHRARNAALRDKVSAAFAAQDHISILDLACGSGSNVRGLATHLPKRQNWRLVDHDPRLLAAGRHALFAWADHVDNDNPLILRKGERRLQVEFDERDLSTFSGGLSEHSADLVTAAAFFDLVSKEWIARFCGELARLRLPLYAVLSYSGEENWSPPHPADSAMLEAFHQHQARDKGFGPAAGPRATELLADSLKSHGYLVETAPSHWRLTSADADLVQSLADGTAAAVSETGFVPRSKVEDWRNAHIQTTVCEIGHLDLFARPI